eukprot:Pgem_evm1s8917
MGWDTTQPKPNPTQTQLNATQTQRNATQPKRNATQRNPNATQPNATQPNQSNPYQPVPSIPLLFRPDPSDLVRSQPDPLQPNPLPPNPPTQPRLISSYPIPYHHFLIIVFPMNNSPILLHEHNEYIDEPVYLKGIEVYCKLIPQLANASD